MQKLGIWAIAIAGAFLIGVVSANPVVEAVGGWQLALGLHEADILTHVDLVTRTNSMVFQPQGTGMFETLCEPGEFELAILEYSLDPPTARLPPEGVAKSLIIDPTGRGNISGDLVIGEKVTVTADNTFVTETTITLAIVCVLNPQLVNPDFLN